MKSFEELGISEDILRAIQEMGYVEPMPVQEQVIPYLLEGKTDLVALAQTGTGKTAAFGLPLLEKIDAGLREPQILIMSPTRELCLQIAGDLKDYGKYLEDVSILPVYGGSSIQNQMQALRRGVQILVATPGRLLDLIRRGAVDLSGIRSVVMDEADEMLDMGFSEDINAILDEVPKDRHTLLFSATMSDEIQKIASNYLHEPVEITIGRRNEGTHNVRHEAFCVHAKDKYEVLKRIVDFHPDIYAIIFCRTRVETQQVAEQLMNDGYNADALHGELSQAMRDTVMQKFRQRHLQLLVATDVAARGLDVDDLTHVINYALPDDVENYTHRSGRTGRAGKTGVSVALINLREKHKLRAIESVIGRKFEPGRIPTNNEICLNQLMNTITNLEMAKVNEDEIEGFMPEVLSKLEWLDREEIIKRVVSLEFNRFLDYYRDRQDIQSVWEEGRGERQRKERMPKGPRQAEAGYTRLFINFGKSDGFYAKDLISLLNRCCQKRRIDVGRIDLLKAFSFFEVPEKDADFVLQALNRAQLSGRYVSVEIADKEGGRKDTTQEKEPGKPSRRQDSRKESGEAKERRPRKERDGAQRLERGQRRPERDVRRQDTGRPERGRGRGRDYNIDQWSERSFGAPSMDEAYGKKSKARRAQQEDVAPAKKAKPSRQERGYDKPRGKKDDWKQFFVHDNEDFT